MWSKLLYLAPIASILSLYETEKEENLQGKLQDELIRFFEDNIQKYKFRIIQNAHLNATINVTYPAHSNLWTIMDGILQRYHLIPSINPNEHGGIDVQLLEGPSWKK